MNIFVVTELLKLYNLEVHAASNGRKAIEIVQRRIQEASMYRLILLDYSLGDTNGPEVAKTIRSLVTEHGGEQPYICCCTAYNGQSFEQEAYSAGMDYFISKPVSKEMLVEILQRAKYF